MIAIFIPSHFMPTFHASNKIDQIVESACERLWCKVDFLGWCAGSNTTKVKFWTISAIFVVADFGGIDTGGYWLSNLAGEGGGTAV